MTKMKCCEYGPLVGFVEHLSLTSAGQQSVAQFITMLVIKWITQKAATKHELLFNKPASDIKFG